MLSLFVQPYLLPVTLQQTYIYTILIVFRVTGILVRIPPLLGVFRPLHAYCQSLFLSHDAHT